jgi:hypothetical protein
MRASRLAAERKNERQCHYVPLNVTWQLFEENMMEPLMGFVA